MMRVTQLLIPAQKEAPNDAKIISHQLMIRAGLISKLASGLYAWLPLGLIVVRKIEAIIRQEMNQSGAQELLMPITQPAELWQKTGRWDEYGAELLRFQDRHQRDFCLGPTHEEIITQLASQYLKSYKQLPMNFYQIQTKFRDEIRPRFGVMRSREFVMKDAYSFHLDESCLQKTYQTMHQTYCRIFDRLSLDYRPVLADSGSIGGDSSHEFHVLADSGEDAIAFCDGSDYAANVERVELLPIASQNLTQKPLTALDTPNIKSIDEVVKFLKVKINKTVKTLIIEDANEQLFAIALRGDHSLNEIKLNKLPQITAPIRLASDNTIKEKLNLEIGSIGVVDLDIPVLVDYSAMALSNFVCGANTADKHLVNVNWDRDVKNATPLDLRNALEGDNSPDGKGKLTIKRGIEVGHIFQLGDKYSTKLGANVINESGKGQSLTMGCYGIGVTRLVGAIIEQHHDDYGIVFPESVAPCSVIIIPINYQKSHRIKLAADKLYQQFQDANIEVMLDDRKERPGICFAQADLLGIPHRIVLSDGLLDKNQIEYKARNHNDKILAPLDDALSFIQDKIFKKSL